MDKKEKTVQRNSSVELLKLLAIVIIALSHGMPDGNPKINPSAIALEDIATNWNNFIILFLHNMGQIGNDVFSIDWLSATN